jgi:hypothetical protein
MNKGAVATLRAVLQAFNKRGPDASAAAMDTGAAAVMGEFGGK